MEYVSDPGLPSLVPGGLQRHRPAPDGCRIGFDAGGSDRKAAADENCFSEEVIWFPKVTEDPGYHYREILRFQGLLPAAAPGGRHRGFQRR